MSYLKDKYVKIELSHYELQIINSIIQEAKHEQNDWFTELNLNDVKRQLNLEVMKVEQNKN